LTLPAKVSLSFFNLKKIYNCEVILYLSSLGLVVSVLAIGPKVRGFKPSLGDVFLRSMTFLRREVMPSAPCRKVLRRVREPFEVSNRYFVRQNSFPSSVPPASLLYDPDGRISGKILCTNHEFSPVDTIPPRCSILIYHLEDVQ
jgi:hypothetical protein